MPLSHHPLFDTVGSGDGELAKRFMDVPRCGRGSNAPWFIAPLPQAALGLSTGARGGPAGDLAPRGTLRKEVAAALAAVK